MVPCSSRRSFTAIFWLKYCAGRLQDALPGVGQSISVKSGERDLNLITPDSRALPLPSLRHRGGIVDGTYGGVAGSFQIDPRDGYDCAGLGGWMLLISMHILLFVLCLALAHLTGTTVRHGMDT
ncbi:hypothetical protein F4808DRAFT_93171 [Astrocystis sublimbata]|nr:hypothetical protein F4808DRAFT_93171 [Astrocystis sublimbata]